MADPIRVLVVVDAREHAEMVVEFLRLSETWGGAQLDIATTYEQALDALQRTSYDVAFVDHVLEARHGLDAIRLAERHPDDIHLMITDLVMPHMSGSDLARRLSTARPRMKVVFSPFL